MSNPATKNDMAYVKSQLLSGDAMKPDDSDTIAQSVNLPTELYPQGDGWRVMTGNRHSNLWARVCYRFEAGL